MLERRDFLKTTVVASMVPSDTAADAQLSAQSPRLFPGFTARPVQTSGAVIHTLVGGSGPPLLLIHGYPQTHVEWHKIAPSLAQRFTVVMTDPATIHATCEDYRAGASIDLEHSNADGAKKVTCPLLVLWGERER